MFLVICLLPLVLAAPLETTLDNYKLDIEEADSGNILKNVELKSGEAVELDLSNMNIHRIEENAFENVRGIKTLNLSNNTLDMLPTSVFSNLTNLENLSLANNNIQYLGKHFVGLKNLQTLDISNNLVYDLTIGEKYGLSKSVTIITKNNYLGYVSNAVDENSYQWYAHITPVIDSFPPFNISRSNIKVCMPDGIVTTVADVADGEDLPPECTQLSFFEQGPVYLQYRGINGFQKGWYNIQLSSISLVSLSFNNITEITEATLNDLPAHITDIDLDGNQIKRIRKGVIKNNNLKSLTLEFNDLEFIEPEAFADTKLERLILRGNKIADLSFVSTLPQTMTYLQLTRNEITSIPDGIFTNLPNLNELSLDSNKITRLQNHVFDGLSSLETLRFVENNITDVEPEAFAGLSNVTLLLCRQNHLVDLPSNVWAPLTSLKQLHLDENGIGHVTKDMISNLPRTLESLYLPWNNISKIESDSFNEVPRKTLDLSYNEITEIPRGALNLPKLKELYLIRNKLTAIDPDSYESLPELESLTLSENEISDIEKGACKNFGNLKELDISMNPIGELKNGALYGLNEKNIRYVSVHGNDLDKVQGGAFEDA